MTSWRLLRADQVVKIHNDIWPGPLRDLGLLESAVAKPSAAYAGHENYPKLLDKVAALLYGLARNHPFQDGNKRTAWHAAHITARINGIDFCLPADEVVADFVEAVARDQLSHDDIVSWLAEIVRTV